MRTIQRKYESGNTNMNARRKKRRDHGRHHAHKHCPCAPPRQTVAPLPPAARAAQYRLHLPHAADISSMVAGARRSPAAARPRPRPRRPLRTGAPPHHPVSAPSSAATREYARAVRVGRNIFYEIKVCVPAVAHNYFYDDKSGTHGRHTRRGAENTGCLWCPRVHFDASRDAARPLCPRGSFAPGMRAGKRAGTARSV